MTDGLKLLQASFANEQKPQLAFQPNPIEDEALFEEPLAQQEPRDDDILFELDDLTLGDNVEL